MRKRITLLGATGSIGKAALDVLERHGERYELFALAVHRNVDGALEAARRFRPRYAVVADAAALDGRAEEFREAGCEVLAGPEALEYVAAHDETDTVVSAIVGAAALKPTLAALAAGKRVALANKEALVMAGELMNRTAEHCGGEILPVDSEHSAVFQCLGGRRADAVERVTLTASGGPFRETPREEFSRITVEHALNHPTWDMGAKITVDSATMFNKALEVIEAHFLFGLPYERIGVVVHPQSIVHALVSFRDGSTLAQLSNPDMRLPVQLALSWPERLEGGLKPLDLAAVGALTFEPVDSARFPSVELGFEAGRRGGTAPAVLNAANEVAVRRFLAGEIGFERIFEIVARVLERIPARGADELDTILEADALAREEALGS